jgi:hypothetical protein
MPDSKPIPQLQMCDHKVMPSANRRQLNITWIEASLKPSKTEPNPNFVHNSFSDLHPCYSVFSIAKMVATFAFAVAVALVLVVSQCPLPLASGSPLPAAPR